MGSLQDVGNNKSIRTATFVIDFGGPFHKIRSLMIHQQFFVTPNKGLSGVLTLTLSEHDYTKKNATWADIIMEVFLSPISI